MVAPKIVDYVRNNGALMSVTLELKDPNDITTFMKLIESENVKCECGKTTVNEGNLRIQVDNPLSKDPLGMNMAIPIAYCAACNKLQTLSMVDYTAFRSIVAFLDQLRAADRKKKAGN